MRRRSGGGEYVASKTPFPALPTMSHVGLGQSRPALIVGWVSAYVAALAPRFFTGLPITDHSPSPQSISMRPTLFLRSAKSAAHNAVKKPNFLPWEVYPMIGLMGFLPIWLGYFTYGNLWGKRESLRLTRSGETHLRLPELEGEHH